jgi:hypothetical protein
MSIRFDDGVADHGNISIDFVLIPSAKRLPLNMSAKIVCAPHLRSE